MGRALAELGGLATGMALLLAWATRPAAALASIYVLALCALAGWSAVTALGRPRLGAWVGRSTLLLGVLLAWAGRHPVPWPAEQLIPRGDFPTPAARVWHDLLPPAAWRDLPGEPWVYVGFDGAGPEDVMAARPVLEVAGQRLAVELDPWVPQRWLRGRLPLELLGRELRVAFGFERPRAGLIVFLAPYYQGTLSRVPSAWSGDGSPPPPGAELPVRELGLFGHISGQSPVAVSSWRLAIEVRWIDSDSATSTTPARILAGCY